jgi:hypothetical protein
MGRKGVRKVKKGKGKGRKITNPYEIEMIKNKKKLQKKYFRFGGKYRAKVFHPLAFERGVYTVTVRRSGTEPNDRNTYLTQVMAKSSTSAYKKVINSPDFKRWKENLETRIKEGKERTDYPSKVMWW